MAEDELHYLRSILGNLREVRKYTERHGRVGPSLAGELLADNIDWLDCYIDKVERSLDQFKQRLDSRLNDALVEMKPGVDDSIIGFNDAWDIMRKLFEEAK